MPKSGGDDEAGLLNDQDTVQSLEIIHYDRANQEDDFQGNLIPVPDQSHENQDFLIEQQALASGTSGDQISVLHSATDFDINGGNFATVGGDFFTANRDLHVTIHNHPGPVFRNNNQETGALSSRETHRNTDQALLPPLPVQRSCDIYRRHLASKGRGIPLWIPEPNRNLPMQYQRNGITIGDVGILTASGSFAFLFNICLPREHPINPPTLPENFTPIHVSPVNIHSQSEFKQNSYLASASTVRTQSDGDSTGLVFESSAHDGAVLTMPVGSISEDLGSTGRFRRYVAANMVHWYKYAYYDREYDVKNGDLRLVIGHDKTSFWGMATFSNSTSQQESLQLKFGLMEGRKYGWEYSGMAEVRAGPDVQEIEQLRNNDPTQENVDYTNQCLFVRTMNATLPDKVWEELGIDTESLDLDIGSNRSTHVLPGTETYGSTTSSNAKSAIFHKPTETNTKTKTSSSRAANVITVFSTGSVYSSPLILADHPSKAINSMLLKNRSVNAKMAITEDQDWTSVINDNDSVLPSSQEILERIKTSFIICEEEGVIFLSKITEPARSTHAADPSRSQKQIDSKANSIFPIVDVPGLSKVIYTLKLIDQEINQIKLYKLQCKVTYDRCVRLINVILESSQEDTHLVEIIDQVENIASRINKSVKEWSSWNRLKSFLRRSEILDGIDRLNKDIDETSIKFNIISQSNLNLQFQATRRQQAEMREALQAIINNSEDLKMLLNMQDPHSVEEVMGSIQTELLDSNLEDSKLAVDSDHDIEKDFRAGLWLLHEKTSKLPPLADLTGQITNVSRKPSLTSHKLYEGNWLDHEKVALRLVSSTKDPVVQRQFEIKVQAWRQLRHPNVVPLYGYAHIDSEIYTVTPWMDEGTMITFIKKYPDADRLKIVTDIAAGLEYLHNNGLVHGDLRGVNILFSTDGTARLSDCGISKFLEDLGDTNMTMTFHLHDIRWMAPEVIQQRNNASMHSDVWSFGMLCLEILTGNIPYSHIRRDVAVLTEIENSRTPPRPEAEVSREVSDGMWSLLQRCWGKDPKARPSMSYVRGQLLNLRGFGFSMNNQPSVLKSTFQGARTYQSARPTTATSSISQSSSLDSFDRDFSSTTSKPSTGISNVTSLKPPSFRITTLGNNRPQKLPHYRESADDAFTEALLDSRPIIHIVDGTVVSGTLEGLVQHLLTCNFNSLPDQDFRGVFLTAFQDFTTPEAFFSILSRCFYEAESNPDIHPEDKVARQYNIFAILIYWVSQDLRFDSQLLPEIRSFCKEASRIKSSWTMSNKAKDLFLLLEEKGQPRLVQKQDESETINPGMGSTSGKKTIRPSEITPNQLAVALTLLEGEKYKSVTPSDYLAHLGRHPGHNNIEGVYTTNNKITLWVKDTILRCGDTSTRASTLKFFIETATECRKLRNFSSMIAIAISLHSDPIERLRLTRMELSSQMHNKLTALKEIIDVTANHRKYREALDDASTGGKQNCVPWLAIHLKDLHNVLQRYPMVVKIDNKPLINFQRYTKLMDRIQEVVPYRPPDLGASQQPLVLEYIEREFVKLDISNITEDDIVARSKKLEAQEVMEHRSRKSQLRNLGFVFSNKI